MDKKLTDRDLIEALVAWYRLDHSTEELRQTVAAYVHQNSSQVLALPEPHPEEAVTKDAEIEPVGHQFAEPSLSVATRSTTTNIADGNLNRPAEYLPQFEPTDELIGVRGWSIDAWALYYGAEDYCQKISFGLLNMQALAFLFCIAISAAVMFGAWQSSLSNERQKKASYKAMEFDLADKKEQSLTPPQPTEPPEVSDATLVSESVENTSNTKVASTFANPLSNEASDATEAEFAPARQLMEVSDWHAALTSLEALERSGKNELQPLLTLMKVEALIQKRDTESMELARQLLMDCDCGEFDTVFDLLVTRWMLLGSPEDRKRFLSEAASLPDATRRRMSTWAHIRNGSKDAMTEVMLETTGSKGPSDVCDLLFIASFHFNIGKYDESIRELLDTQQKLRALQATGKSQIESWLLDSCKSQLMSKVNDIIGMVSHQPRKPIN
jgi:hypothetical protein